jgi:hypothetical protein
MNMAKKRVTGVLLITLAVWLGVMTGTSFAQPSFKASFRSLAEGAKKSGGKEACLTTLLNQNLAPMIIDGLKEKSLGGMKGSIRAIVGGRNFTPADIDSTGIPFLCPASGLGGSTIYHDGGAWPNSGGNPDKDDGVSNFGSDQAEEIYDYDGNGHYPKAVLRYIGAHCYIFVPVMNFPTLPKFISSTEQETPAAKSAWGMYWPDTAGWSQGRYYYAPATGAKTLEPRYVLGSDKNLARMKLKELADEFDGNIYPRMREYFGSEPDVDGDPKVFILLDDIRDGQGSFRGYVWKANQFKNSVYPRSNEKELIHLDLFPTFLLSAQQGYRTIAHEFTHLIAFNEGDIVTGTDINQKDLWIEEGFTQYASYVYDKSHTPNVDEFIKKPDTPLTIWDHNEPYANYGVSYLLTFYLMEQYGKNNPQTFMRNMVKDKARGITVYDNALKGFNTTFKEVFSDFTVANFLNKTRKMDGSPLNDGKWGYFIDNDYDSTNDMGVNERLPVKFSERVILGPKGATRSGNVNPWAADYIEMSGNTGNVNIGFDGDDRTEFKCAVIKRGPQVDPTVEFIYLNEKQAGNLIIQNYGYGNTYENLILVPSIVSAGNQVQGTYVFSASFADLKLAMFPNPVFENELHIIVRTTDKFASTPRLQITYQGEQGYLVMTAINDSTYITNYKVKNSGEGELDAYGTTINGQILSNKLKFSAVYYPPRSQGSLSASFAALQVPPGAVKNGGLFMLSVNSAEVSYPGLTNLSRLVDVSIPGNAAQSPLTLQIPTRVTGIQANHRLGLFEAGDKGAKYLGEAILDGATFTASISKGGTVFVAEDGAAPVVKVEEENTEENRIVFKLEDLGAGIDPKSIAVRSKDRLLPVAFDPTTGRATVQTQSLGKGTHDLEIQVADKLGNTSQSRISAQFAGPLSRREMVVFPSPARTFAKFRVTYNGTGAAAMGIEATVREIHGEEVYSTVLRHIGDGIYEATWNLRNYDGKEVANGPYLLELDVWGNGQETKERRKFAVLR